MTSYSNNNSKAIVNIGLHHWSGVAIWWVSLSIHVHYSVKSLLAPNESLWVDILLVLLLPGWGKYNTKPEMPKILQSQRMIMSQPEAISRENLLKFGYIHLEMRYVIAQTREKLQYSTSLHTWWNARQHLAVLWTLISVCCMEMMF